MAGTQRSREQSKVSWEVNLVRHTGLRGREESTVTPRLLDEVGECRLVALNTEKAWGGGTGSDGESLVLEILQVRG